MTKTYGEQQIGKEIIRKQKGKADQSNLEVKSFLIGVLKINKENDKIYDCSID